MLAVFALPACGGGDVPDAEVDVRFVGQLESLTRNPDDQDEIEIMVVGFDGGTLSITFPSEPPESAPSTLTPIGARLSVAVDDVHCAEDARDPFTHWRAGMLTDVVVNLDWEPTAEEFPYMAAHNVVIHCDSLNTGD